MTFPPFAGLALGVLGLSFAAVMVRLTEPAPALTVAAWRMTLSALLVLPVVLCRGRESLAEMSPKDRALAALAGGFLGVHFATWFLSLRYTTTASSVVLVTTQPVFVAALSALVIREKLSLRAAAGIGVAFLGSLIISFGDLRLGRDYLLGDGLALVGAIMAALYMLVGRRVRQRASLLPYVFLTYTAASACLLAACLIFGSPLTLPAHAAFWSLMLALVPTLLGHTLVNWSLRFVPAYAVAVCVLGEPVGSAFWAYLLFGDTLARATYAGASLIFTGVWLTIRPGRKIPGS
ncbi:MAG: DMT family transporter [Armatimonadetes bacterium]|nr:DMT family transporter [Armatimonadota bacterium]